ncbi:hypothetical protein ACOMHN_054291 [Nucella lapillus]
MAARHLEQNPQPSSSHMSEVHVYGVITIVLELCMCVENFLPLLVLLQWKRPRERSVADKLLAALSAIYILSALVPTPLGLASYFHGSWYGGAATCECFQVTSTWCSLAALAVVTYLSVDLQLTACSRRARAQHVPETSRGTQQNSAAAEPSPAQTSASTAQQNTYPSTNGRDLTNIILFLVFIVTLLIASLPVVGYGPQVMADNVTCDSWLIQTPLSGQRRTYFLTVLVFGFLCLGTVVVSMTATMCTLRSLQRWTRWEGQARYTEDLEDHHHHHHQRQSHCQSSAAGSWAEGSRSDSYCYKMAGLAVANQIMWIPVLVIVSVQKAGYPVTEATIMYAILFTSLPGLLNPLLLALLYSDYRLGYRYVLLRLCCCCCPPSGQVVSTMKNLRSRSRDSLNQPHDGELSINESLQDIDDLPVAGKSYPLHACSQGAESDDTGDDLQQCQSYVVVELPTERTPLQMQGAGNSRPIIASLYDEYGELSGAPKTELLSPCGSEECLLTSELFRSQTESVV